MKIRKKQMGKLVMICVLAVSMLTGIAVAEVDLADVLKNPASILCSSAKAEKNESKLTKGEKKKEAKKKKSDKKQKKEAGKKDQKGAAGQQKNDDLKDIMALFQQNNADRAEQSKDVLTRMVETKTLSKNAVDNINAYLKYENAALNKISALVNNGKLKENMLKTLENFVEQMRKDAVKSGAAADILFTRSTLQTMLLEKVITQDEHDAIVSQLTQDLLEAAQKAQYISQAELEAAKPLLTKSANNG